jgi:hypothetical protein
MDYRDLYCLEFSTHETTKRLLAKVQAERDALKAQLAEVHATVGDQLAQLTEVRATVSDQLRPMNEAPTTGPIVEILVATTNRAGCNGWLIVHYADGGGEEQPRFRGWFYWTGYGFNQIDSSSLIGWLPLPVLERVRTAVPHDPHCSSTS